MEKLTIRAVEGRRLPLPDDPKRCVEGTMTVPSTTYYRRALKRGDIELATSSVASTTNKEKQS